MSGWICSYRMIWSHSFFKGHGMRVAVWHWLLHHAAWQDTSHSVGKAKVAIRRGEVCFSQQQIQDDTGASRRQVREVIDWLIQGEKATKIPANERANKGANVRANAKTILRIDKYDEYQRRDAVPANERANKGADERPTKEQDNNITTLEPNGSLSAEADFWDDIAEAVRIFRETAKRQGWPSIRILSKARSAALKARLRECGGIEGWRDALTRAAASDLLNGINDRGWICNFDFLTRQSSFSKLMEGNYDNRTNPRGRAPNSRGSSPHDSLLAGFSAYADSDDGRGERGFSGSGSVDDTSQQEVDSGQGGNASQPILRVIGSS